MADSLGIVYERGQALERDGRREAARELYELTLRQGAGAVTSIDAAQLVRYIARTWMHDANYEAARDCATCALAIAEQGGDAAGEGHATNILAVLEWKQGHLDAARRLYVKARALAEYAGDARLAVMTASNLGVIENVQGDERAAREAYESSLGAARAAGLPDQAIAALCNIGQLELQVGRLDVAERRFAEARDICLVLGDRGVLVEVDLHLAKLRLRQGLHARAREACERAHAMIAETGDAREMGNAAYTSGLVARAGGDLVGAEQHFQRAESIAVEREDLIIQGETARELADLYRAQGRNRQTLQRLNQAHRIFAQLRARREMADVDRRTAVLENDFLDVVRKWGESIESKDVYTQGHCVRVADLACALWMRVQDNDTSLFWFRIGALLHDVGKLMIPADVLNKPGELTQEEWAMVRAHPSVGVALLADIEFPWDVRPIVESHHERWDGQGYPHGLAGETIPLPARVLCIADVYDALTSRRSYKLPASHDEAMAIMRGDAGRQFDPVLFAAFDAMVSAPPAGANGERHLALIA